MKIIEARPAPNPRRVRIFLSEKGIEIAFEDISIMELNHKTPDFAAMNPMQRVPVLVLDNGKTISESVAICRYFEELHPEPPLMGTDPFDKACVEMWNRRVEHWLFFHVTQAFRHTNERMAELEVPQIAKWGEANKPKVLEDLSLLDETLGAHEFIAGERYSIADITALVAIDFMRVIKFSIPDHLTHLKRWHESVSARPSAAA